MFLFKSLSVISTGLNHLFRNVFIRLIVESVAKLLIRTSDLLQLHVLVEGLSVSQMRVGVGKSIHFAFAKANGDVFKAHGFFNSVGDVGNTFT